MKTAWAGQASCTSPFPSLVCQSGSQSRSLSFGGFATTLASGERFFFFFFFFFSKSLTRGFSLSYLLHVQSTRHLLVKWYKEILNPDPVTRPTVYRWTKRLLSAPRGPDYQFDTAPAALNTWLIFRFGTDFVLGHDLGSYVLVLITYWEWPERFSLGVVSLYVLGFLFAAFAAWAKRDAYRVIKDYAWFWGDFFFTVKQSLTFDRVFALSPHPMYTIGYAFMYGFALLSRSYTVLYVGLFGHSCQLIFLVLVENPHIDKIYAGIQSTMTADDVARQRGYLRRDLIAFRNFNPFRSSDLMFIVIVLQTVACYFWGLSLVQWTVVVLVWRLIHTVGLGLILHLQSTRDAVVVSFKEQGWTREDAFDSWKKVYNTSATMQWICFGVAAISVYPTECWYTYSWNLCLTKHIVAIGLIALNMWSVVSQFEIIGEFGWFFGDFFINDEAIPLKLSYQGIYRFLENPDSQIGFAGFYGLALLSESFTLFSLAAFGQVSSYLFVLLVERPHMRRKYGDAVRGTSGAASALLQIVGEEVKKAKKIISQLDLSPGPRAKAEDARGDKTKKA